MQGVAASRVTSETTATAMQPVRVAESPDASRNPLAVLVISVAETADANQTAALPVAAQTVSGCCVRAIVSRFPYQTGQHLQSRAPDAIDVETAGEARRQRTSQPG
ncbi:hypothetical protein A5659_15760 [Mycobacterium sp. 1165196.3]|nr:hypothetical protein A5659_15760 [Mycobacterium sp. 1165196.3]